MHVWAGCSGLARSRLCVAGLIFGFGIGRCGLDWNVAEFGTTIGPFLQHVVRARGFVERCGFLTSFILMNGTLDASGTCFAVCRSTLDSRAQAHLRLHIRVSTVSKSCVIHLVRSEGSANICREWRILGILHLTPCRNC